MTEDRDEVEALLREERAVEELRGALTAVWSTVGVLRTLLAAGPGASPDVVAQARERYDEAKHRWRAAVLGPAAEDLEEALVDVATPWVREDRRQRTRRLIEKLRSLAG